jgi:hypothetical protein
VLLPRDVDTTLEPLAGAFESLPTAYDERGALLFCFKFHK